MLANGLKNVMLCEVLRLHVVLHMLFAINSYISQMAFSYIQLNKVSLNIFISEFNTTYEKNCQTSIIGLERKHKYL